MKETQFKTIKFESIGGKDSDFEGGKVGSGFRMVNRWARNNGYIGAFPLFITIDRNHNRGIFSVLLGDDIAEWHDVTTECLGLSHNVDYYGDNGSGPAFRAAYSYGNRSGYVGAFPNFESSGNKNGIILLNKADGRVTWKDYTRHQLSSLPHNTDYYGQDGEDTYWCISTVDNSVNIGDHVHGFPNFESSGDLNGVIVIELSV